MTTKIPCYIEFTDSGNYARLVHKSGMVIAEFLIYDTNFSHRALSAYDRLGLLNFPRIHKPYRAEVNEIVSTAIINEEVKELLDMAEHFENVEERLEFEKEKEDEEKPEPF